MSGFLRRLYFPTEQLLETHSESLDVPTDFSLFSNFITKSTFVIFLRKTFDYNWEGWGYCFKNKMIIRRNLWWFMLVMWWQTEELWKENDLLNLKKGFVSFVIITFIKKVGVSFQPLSLVPSGTCQHLSSFECSLKTGSHS